MIHPVSHEPTTTIPIPFLPVSLDYVLDKTDMSPELCVSEEDSEASDTSEPKPILFTQSELNDLVRDSPSKGICGGFRLKIKEKNLLASGTSF